MSAAEVVLIIIGGVCIVVPLTLTISVLWDSPEAADRDRPETLIPTTDE
jgi:hypothetical protein